MKRIEAVAAVVEARGIVRAELEDGRLIYVVFDEYGLPHAGRRLTTTTHEGYIVEIILPYEVRVRKIGQPRQEET